MEILFSTCFTFAMNFQEHLVENKPYIVYCGKIDSMVDSVQGNGSSWMNSSKSYMEIYHRVSNDSSVIVIEMTSKMNLIMASHVC